MPSNTYNNLSKEKKEKLIKAAIKEFSSVPYNKASINNIISKAGISRGSFYMYFENKEELFQYILYSHKEKFDEIIKISLITSSGDLKTSFIKIFDYIIDYISEEDNDFFKQVFLNLNYQNKQYIVPEKFGRKNKTKEFEKYIDKKKLVLSSNITLDDIFEIYISILIPGIIKYILKDTDLSIIRKNFNKKINLLCFGIYRKDDNS